MITKLKALQSHQGFIRYFKNTSWMVAEKFLRIIAGLFVGIWVARYLGPEQFGQFSYVLAFTAIFGAIAKLGLDAIIVREIVNHPEKRDAYLGTAFWLKALGAFLVMGFLVAIVPFTSNDSTTNVFIFIIASGLIFQSFEVVEFYFQSQVLAKVVSMCKVFQLALSSMIKIYLVLTESELIYFVIVTAFDAFSLAVSYFIAYKIKNQSAFYKNFDLRIAKQLLKDSWPLIFSAVIVVIYMRIDQVMIKEMLGYYEVGLYSASVKLSEAWYFIPTIIATSFFPALISARSKSISLYEQRIIYLYALLIWGSIIVAMFVFFFSESIIETLFGLTYLESSMALVIHVWAGIFVSAAVLRGKWFVAENLVKYSLYTVVVGVLFNIVLNYYLIQAYGINGAALATLLARLISFYLISFLFVEVRPAIKHFHSGLIFPFTYLRSKF